MRMRKCSEYAADEHILYYMLVRCIFTAFWHTQYDWRVFNPFFSMQLLSHCGISAAQTIFTPTKIIAGTEECMICENMRSRAQWSTSLTLTSYTAINFVVHSMECGVPASERWYSV